MLVCSGPEADLATFTRALMFAAIGLPLLWIFHDFFLHVGASPILLRSADAGTHWFFGYNLVKLLWCSEKLGVFTSHPLLLCVTLAVCMVQAVRTVLNAEFHTPAQEVRTVSRP